MIVGLLKVSPNLRPANHYQTPLGEGIPTLPITPLSKVNVGPTRLIYGVSFFQLYA